MQDAAIPRMAAGGDQNFLQQLLGRFKGGKAGGAAKVLSKAGIPLAGLSVLGSAMAAGQEFDGEGAGVDTAQAAGRFVGDLGTTATLAGLGTIIAPGVGTVALPVLGALLGVNEGVGKGGAGLAEAIYSGVTGDTEARRKAARYRQETDLYGERLMQLAPVQNTIAKMRDARELAMARQAAEIQSDYNFANTLNDKSLMLQQNEANALNIALQNLL
ncbi:MAG TPA: hypothetical protein DEP13_08115 [Gammaproteobacteria bacterium]|nr:hypothetical protein [Gammaproteobacteria bacterium]